MLPMLSDSIRVFIVLACNWRMAFQAASIVSPTFTGPFVMRLLCLLLLCCLSMSSLALASEAGHRAAAEDRKSTRLNQSRPHLVCRLLLEKKNNNRRRRAWGGDAESAARRRSDGRE